MKEIKKGKCKGCGELRILFKDKSCIFCRKRERVGTEVKTFHGRGVGLEIKSKTGKTDENLWMRQV